MKTRLLAFVVAFMMVMSIASVAFAARSETSTDVYYYARSNDSSPYRTDVITGIPDSGTSRDITITMPAAPTRSNYTFAGFNLYLDSKSGTLLASYVQAGASVTVQITRSGTNSNWRAVYAVAQWVQTSQLDTSASVGFYNNADSGSTYQTGSVSLSGTATSQSVTVNMPATAPIRSGYAFTGFNVYTGSKNGTLVQSSVQAGGSAVFTLTRSNISQSWPDIYVVGQWTRTYEGDMMSHVDIRVPASVRVVTKLDGVVTSDVTYSATVISATGKVNGTTLGFPSSPNSSNEFRANLSFRHYSTNVVDLTVTLRVTIDGQTQTITAPLSYTGAALLAAIEECPGSGSSKGYDIIIATEDISEAFTHEVKFLTTTGGTLSGTTTFSGILHDTAWSAAVTEPGKNPSNGYVFDGWYDEQNNKVTSFPAKVTEDRTFTAKWTALADVTQKYYSVTYKIDLNLDGDFNDAGETVNAYVDVTTRPATVAADASKQGYTFAGWFKQGTTTKLTALVAGNYDLNSSRTVVIPAGPGTAKITKEYYEITLTGTLTKKTSQKTVYSVFYSGEHEGATFWPVSVNNATTPPTIAGPGTKIGYTFSGWNPSSLDWSADYVVVTTDAEIYESASDTFLTVTRKTITVTGSFTKAQEIVNTYYTVIYKIDLDGDGTFADAGETFILDGQNESTTMPDTVSGAPAGVPQGFKFNGWSKSAPLVFADYTKVYDEITTPSTQPEVGDVRTVKYELVILGTISENAHETQTFYNLQYQITGSYTHPDGSALTPANVPGDQLNVAETAPTVSGTLPTMNGHTFSGWSALNWGTAVHTTGYNPSTNAIIDIYTYTATVQGSFSANTVIENKYYSLSYSIDGTYYHADGTTLSPTKPANVTDQLNSKPSLAAGHALDGHSFAGWKQNGSAVTDSTIDFAQVGSTTYVLNDDNQYEATSYYAAAVVGSYTSNGLEEKSLYNLTYTGSSDLADAGTWPANVSDASSAPSLTTLTPAKLGYTFGGWKQGGSTVTNIDWGTGSVDYTLNSANKYVKTTTYSATVNGVLTKNGSVNEYIYIVDYTVTGGETSYDNLDVNVTNPATPPVIAADLNESGKVFSGWTPASLNWGGVTAVVVTDARYENGKWVNTHTKTINVSGSFGTIEHVNVYELTFTGPAGATLPGMKSSIGSAPAIGSEEASLSGHRFNGWNPASVSESDYVENTGRLTTSTDGLTVTHYFEASTEAQFVQTGTAEHYTLHYNITGTILPESGIPGPSTGSSPIAPNQSNVPATILDGTYYFSGWSAPSWGNPVRTETETVNGVEITTSYYEATVTGEYTNIPTIGEKTLYSLIYEGYVSGALFWPADVINSETPPTLAGAPYLAGYTFNGWTPGALNWQLATVSTDRQLMEGENGPYYLTVYTMTVRVRANFVQDETPGEPEDPEIPLGSPQTGSVEMIGFGFAFVALGAAVMTATVIRRRRNNADGE